MSKPKREKVVDIDVKRREKARLRFNAERLDRVLTEFLDAHDANNEEGKALAGRALSKYPGEEVNKAARRLEAQRKRAKREATVLRLAAELETLPEQPTEAS